MSECLQRTEVGWRVKAGGFSLHRLCNGEPCNEGELCLRFRRVFVLSGAQSGAGLQVN